MNIRLVFPMVAAKTLVSVDLPHRGSNQHEINGVAKLREFFSGESRNEPIEWAYFADDQEPIHEVGTVTFYDARAKSHEETGRTEWRLYYYGDFLSNASAGDLLILARHKSGDLIGLVFQADSAWLSAASNVFDLGDIATRLELLPVTDLDRDAGVTATRLLDELGIEAEVPIDSQIETAAAEELEKARKDHLLFPSTRTMASRARSLVDIEEMEPDAALMGWLRAEEALFRAVEAIVVGKRLEEGFESVDDFVSYSLSVHNRRKSRMGHALQNHLEYLFTLSGLRFEAQAKTEGKNTPDFLFPGEKEYHDSSFNSNKLRMLAAKSSCKERWRQILTEAQRVPEKHLCTLDCTISQSQTDEMTLHHVILVIPEEIQAAYRQQQRLTMIPVSQFIRDVRSIQV